MQQGIRSLIVWHGITYPMFALTVVNHYSGIPRTTVPTTFLNRCIDTSRLGLKTLTFFVSRGVTINGVRETLKTCGFTAKKDVII